MVRTKITIGIGHSRTVTMFYDVRIGRSSVLYIFPAKKNGIELLTRRRGRITRNIFSKFAPSR